MIKHSLLSYIHFLWLIFLIIVQDVNVSDCIEFQSKVEMLYSAQLFISLPSAHDDE